MEIFMEQRIERLIHKAGVLVEALPYIQKFYGKTVVIKYGGNAMINEDLKNRVMEDITLLKYIGINPIVVHGGGPDISAALTRFGIQSEFINGLRVTDDETMRVAQMVLIGKTNKEIVSLLGTKGGKGIGISGIDGGLIRCQKYYTEVDGKKTDIGYVGDIIHIDDKILVISNPIDIEAITVFFGKQVEMEWEQLNKKLISRRILITKPELNGKMLSQLKIRNNFGASITRINRSGVDLVASPHLQLQMGDRVTIVGSELAVTHAEKVLGNSMKRLNHPNLIPIFFGIALGCILGSIPFMFPGIPQPVKLGLAGGPLIVSILISRFGPQYKMITYTTMSANLMIREIGISLFLACVGLGAGKDFIETIVNEGGYIWIMYGAIITTVPLIITGLIGRYACKLNYYTLIGVLSGANTNPPALAYSNDLTSCDAPAVGYATVYPLAMFLRVLTAQLLILSLG